MPLQRIQLRPGVTRDTTNFAAEGTWWDCDKVRFRAGLPEKIGGWVRAFPDTLDGVIYSLRAWATISPYRTLTGIGTSRRFYVEANGQVVDITPASTSATPANPFTTTAGSPLVVVSFPNHGLQPGGAVAISGVLAPVNGIPAATLNSTFVVDVIDSASFQINTSYLASSSGVGGGAPLLQGLAPSAVDIVQVSTGWGAPPWNTGGWGDPYTGSNLPAQLPQLWTQDNLGSDLVITPRGGQIYYWSFDGGGGLGRRAVSIRSIAAALPVQTPQPDISWVPVAANIALFDSRSEILIAVGVNPTPSDSIIDPMFVRWADESDPYDWEPRIDNRAGGKRLTSGSQLIAALRVRENTIIWSDTTIYSMQFIGGNDQFTIEPLYEGITIQGPNAAVVIGGAAYWMGDKVFYKYDGSLTQIDCPIKDRVFDNISRIRGSQVACGYNERFDEIWWFYCDNDDLTPTKYVIYNFRENVWTYGNLDRSAWSLQQFANRPYAGQPTAGLDEWGASKYTSSALIHEVGVDDAAGVPTEGNPGGALPINAFIESADFDISEGHVYSFVSKVLPDIRFDNSTDTNPSVSVTMKWRNEPGNEQNTDPSLNVAQIDAGRYTPQLDFRLRARQVAIRIESNQLGCQWRWGIPRLDIRPDGRQ